MAKRELEVVLGLLVVAAPLALTQTLVPRVGMRARVVFQGDSLGATTYVTGSIVRFGSDSVVLGLAGAETLSPVALGVGRRLEISAGRRGHALVGATIGFGVGLVAGALVGAGSVQPERCVPTCGVSGSGPGFAVVGVAAGAVLGGVVGTILGAVVGHGIGPERWLPAAQEPVGTIR
jgi:hypothetical protein